VIKLSNIGHVQYSKGDVTGELKAVWLHEDNGRGTCLATGSTNSEFEGNYQIKYFDENSILLAELDLEIINNGSRYNLTWSKGGLVTSVGIAMENSSTLFVGYYDVE